MLDTMTSRASPTAASHAANTIRIIGIIIAIVKCMLRIIRVLRIKRDSIMPSKHSRDDIMCERYTSTPTMAMENAIIMFK